MAQITDTHTDDQLAEIARRGNSRGYDLETMLTHLDFETDAARERFKIGWEPAVSPETYGEAFERGFGDRYNIAGWDVPVVPKGFFDNAGEMAQALGELIFTEAPSYIGGKVGSAPFLGAPGEIGGRAREEFAGVESRVVKQLIQELTTPESAAIQSIRSDIAMTRDLAEGERLRDALEMAIESENPLTSFLWEMTQKEIFYFTSRQALMDKIAEAPAEVVSDIASVIAPILKTPALASKYPRVSKILGILVESTDVTTWPGHGTRALERGTRGALRGPDVEMTDQSRSLEFGRDPETGEMLTTELNPGKAAEDFGAGKEMTPDFVRNPQQKFQTREMMRAEQEGGVGQRAWERKEGTEAAIVSTQERMVADLQEGNNPFDAETGGTRVMDHYEDRQRTDRSEVSSLFSEWNANYEEQLSPEFGLEAKLQKIIDDLRGGGKAVSPADRKAADIIEAELNAMRTELAKGVKAGGGDTPVADTGLTGINEMSLQSLDKLRTNFREAYKSAFLRKEVTEMGAGGEGGKAYTQLSDLLYEAVDDAVQRSGGSMPAELSQGLLAAKTRRAEIAQLENTEGGKFLIKNQSNPIQLVDGLLTDKKITTAEIGNIYELIGEEGARDLQATLLNRIFEKMPNGATGLQRYLDTLTSGRDKSRLIKMFGGDERGKEIVEELHQFAQFSALMEPVPRLFKNSPTGKINMALAGGAAGSAFGALREVFQMVFYGSDDAAAAAVMAAGAGTLSWMSKNGINFWEHSEIGRKRLLEGLRLPAAMESILNDLIEVTQRKNVKTAELASRLEGVEEEEGLERLNTIDPPQ